MDKENSIWPFVWQSIISDMKLIGVFLGYVGYYCMLFLFVFKFSIRTGSWLDIFSQNPLFPFIVFASPFVMSVVFRIIISTTVIARAKKNEPTALMVISNILTRLWLIGVLSFLKMLVICVFIVVDFTINLIYKIIFRSNDPPYSMAKSLLEFILASEAANGIGYLDLLIPLSISSGETSMSDLSVHLNKLLKKNSMVGFKTYTKLWVLILGWLGLFLFASIISGPFHSMIPFWLSLYLIIPIFLLMGAVEHIALSAFILRLQEAQASGIRINIDSLNEIGIYRKDE